MSIQATLCVLCSLGQVDHQLPAWHPGQDSYKRLGRGWSLQLRGVHLFHSDHAATQLLGIRQFAESAFQRTAV